MEPIEAILTTLEEYTNVSLASMKGRCRQANIREARQLAIHFIHKYSGLSMTKSARMMNRHHSTGIHTNKVIENELLTNKKYKSDYHFLKAVITNKIKNG
jgi:chromosomal replication initiation ATPase DnaA